MTTTPLLVSVHVYPVIASGLLKALQILDEHRLLPTAGDESVEVGIISPSLAKCFVDSVYMPDAHGDHAQGLSWPPAHMLPYDFNDMSKLVTD